MSSYNLDLFNFKALVGWLYFMYFNFEFYFQINEILPPHYHDITEERSISMVCGYPLCNNKLLKVLSSYTYFHVSYNNIAV